MSLHLKYFFILGLIYSIQCIQKECIVRHIPNSDTVCVCNATYCDTIPKILKPKTGFASVYESNKSGVRFKKTGLKIESTFEKSNVKNSQTITIDGKQLYQRINGFGAAFTDSTGVMLNKVPVSLSTAIIDSYFSNNGIEYSMARIPIACSDYSTHPYSYDDIDGDLNLTHFALPKDDFDYKIPYIKLAQKLSPHNIKHFGSPWSPPDWMKANRNQSGALKGPVGGVYYQTWANYFLKFLEAYKSHGINFWGLTIENEPVVGLNPKSTFNWLNLTAPIESEFIAKNLGPTLEKAGYTKDIFKIMIFDDNAGNLQEWADTILNYKPAAKYVSGIAYHWYGNHRMSGFPDTLLASIHNKYPDMFTLNTEACHLEGPGNGRWDFGEHYAYDIIRALNNWVTGWVEWNMALDMTGGPRWNGPGGFGGPVYIDPEAIEAYKQPTFYTIGHFSKLIPPNSVRIGHKIDKEVEGLSILTVKRPDNSTVLVALNAKNEDIAIHINDTNNYVSHTIPARSIQSYIW